MIKQWTLRNFKSVQNETELEMALLIILWATLLCR